MVGERLATPGLHRICKFQKVQKVETNITPDNSMQVFISAVSGYVVVNIQMHYFVFHVFYLDTTMVTLHGLKQDKLF